MLHLRDQYEVPEEPPYHIMQVGQSGVLMRSKVYQTKYCGFLALQHSKLAVLWEHFDADPVWI